MIFFERPFPSLRVGQTENVCKSTVRQKGSRRRREAAKDGISDVSGHVVTVRQDGLDPAPGGEQVRKRIKGKNRKKSDRQNERPEEPGQPGGLF
jgi:hypothetical protein